MRWYIPAGLAILAGTAGAVISEKCLEMITRPVRYDAEYVKNLDTSNGFGDCFRKYENEWKRIGFSVECDGARIAGEYIENPTPGTSQKKIVIICHGHTVNRYSDIKYADIFYRAGFNVIIFDQRYFGESTGDFCTLGQNEAYDLAELIDFTRGLFGQDCVIGLHGESMGAATALLSLKYKKPDFIVADCPFADSKLLFSQWIKKNLHLPFAPIWPIFKVIAKEKYSYDIEGTSPLAAVSGADVPICFMHGRSDMLIDNSHSEMLFAACRNQRSELHFFDGADHAQSVVVDREKYEKTLLDFLHSCGFAEVQS